MKAMATVLTAMPDFQFLCSLTTSLNSRLTMKTPYLQLSSLFVALAFIVPPVGAEEPAPPVMIKCPCKNHRTKTHNGHRPQHIPKDGGGTSDPCGDGSDAFKTFGKWNKSIVKWAFSTDQVTLDFLNANGFARLAVERAFDSWTGVNASDLVFVLLPDGDSDADVLVDFRPLDGAGGTVAQVASSFIGRQQKYWIIGSQTMSFDTEESWGELVDQCPPDQNELRFDLEDVAAHEAGHVVGLDHAGDAALTMYAYVTQGETSKRTLGNGDKAGASKLY